MDAPAKRLWVVELLCEAAELEHNLLCQYLFAAFSLKREPAEDVTWQQLERIRSWETALLKVARQEMEHLGLVSNLLTSLGEAPYLTRPNFPLAARHYDLRIPSHLERFNRASLIRFIRFERPHQLSAAQRKLFNSLVPPADRAASDTIGELYTTIASALHDLAHTHPYVGPPGKQLEAGQGLHGIDVSGAANYDVRLEPVTDNRSAQEVIRRIVTEGEGSPHARGPANTSHFATFCTILLELDVEVQGDPAFEPARPVATLTADGERDLGGPTRAVLDLFDLAYQTLMLMLFRYFAHGDESGDDIVFLGNAAFFPMMTAVIRPLGEVITTLPVGDDGTQRTGPRFTFERPVTLLPHRRSAWNVISSHLELLASEAWRCTQAVGTGPSRKRLQLIAENLSRMNTDFAADHKASY